MNYECILNMLIIMSNLLNMYSILRYKVHLQLPGLKFNKLNKKNICIFVSLSLKTYKFDSKITLYKGNKIYLK